MSNVIKDRLKSKLNKERASLSTFEFTLTLPMTILIVFIVFYIFMMLTAWINFNALAGEIAKDLNFRQTGIHVASQWMQEQGTPDRVIAGRDSTGAQHNIEWDSITINGVRRSYADKYTQCVGYSMQQHASQFFMVYANYNNDAAGGGTQVELRKTTNGSDSYVDTEFMGKRMSNHIIKVTMRYQFFPMHVFGFNFPGFDMYSTGYSVIT